jgi:hypothetical protein
MDYLLEAINKASLILVGYVVVAGIIIYLVEMNLKTKIKWLLIWRSLKLWDFKLAWSILRSK